MTVELSPADRALLERIAQSLDEIRTILSAAHARRDVTITVDQVSGEHMAERLAEGIKRWHEATS